MHTLNVNGFTHQITQSELDEALEDAPDLMMGLTEHLTRIVRGTLLTETDWCANSDVIMSDDMTTYRQALRDITDQAGFPTNITWPTKP
jgi:hypothetical protein